MKPEQLDALYHAVQTRPRPEDVALLVLNLLGDSLTSQERAVLEVPAHGSFWRGLQAYSSMAADFVRPVGAERQVKRAAVLFGVATPRMPTPAECLDVVCVETYVRELGAALRKEFGASSFKHDRLDRAKRVAAGLPKGHRAYNKRFRLLVRMEKKLHAMVWNGKRYAMTRIAKSGLAYRVSREDILADINTACLTAYLGAKMSQRSVFTNKSQARAFDESAEILLRRCEASRSTRWDVITRLMADRRVVRHLPESQRGELLGEWWEVLVEAADMLQVTAQENKIDRVAMVVGRGNDSSTWNALAGAWNKAREGWLSLATALGMDAVVDGLCPGKVMRLMAADVARWHKASGGDVHPDTKVWAALPAPWEVVRGEATCSRATVEAACKLANVDPKGWTVPRGAREAVAWKPTPELVHGVEVSSPALALALRKAGVFSGKGLRGEVPAVHVERDEFGAALRVDPIAEEAAAER